ncbi:TonB-dependent receptor [Cellvibrio sp. UBA7661]|uniref:TonB-dependent receptor n=1 Tax=Cellvibrio sp. UBA7661 TaxID=1946311 RepID=UPI002F35B0F2
MRNKLSDAIKLANKSALMLGSVAAVAMMGFATTANAQDAGAEPEEVIVTGIRGALKNAVDIKRNSTSVVDAVSAEDVGKFPDSDVGQSLGRIPGVAVGRENGQGASVSIRGAAPQMTLTTLNGQTVASTGWYDQKSTDRSFNYSLLPSQLIGGMEVYKSSQADIAEGGAGGTVIIKTRKPLDMDANSVYLGVKAKTGTVADDVTPEVSGLYSWKNDSESFGILVAGAFEEGDYVRRGTESDYQWWSDVSPTTFIQERERTALDVTAQFKPTENLSFGVHALSLDLKGDNTNTSMYLFNSAASGFPNTYACQETNAAGACIKSTTQPKDGDLGVGWASGTLGTETFTQTWGRVASMKSETIDLDGEYTGDGFTLTGRVGQTKADGGTDLTTNFQHFPSLGDNMSVWGGSIDATGKKIKIDASVDPSVTLSDYRATVSPEGWSIGRGPNSDEEVYAQFDIEFELDAGPLTAFKTGVRTTDHDVNRQSFKPTLKTGIDPVATSSVYSGTYEVGENGFTAPEPNLSAMIAETKKHIAGWNEVRSGYVDLNEQNDAIYGMFTLEADGVRGNFGLRYISSDITSNQYELDGTVDAANGGLNEGFSKSLTARSANYHDVLPSANFAFDVAEDVVLRVSASQAINRPSYDDMINITSGFADDRGNNQVRRIGNVGMKPVKSSQADVGVEYYYGDGNMISATYFVKTLSNTMTSTFESNQPLIFDPKAGNNSWTIETLTDSGSAQIDGIELQINHAFDNGFGIAANVTFVDTDVPLNTYSDEIGVFTESSDKSANLVGYWENDVFSARAAYNWRSEYMIREGSYYYGNRMHDDFGTLDLSFGWNFTDSLNLTFEAINILEEDDVQYGAADVSTASNGVKLPLLEGFPAWSSQGEATYMLGLNYKF